MGGRYEAKSVRILMDYVKDCTGPYAWWAYTVEYRGRVVGPIHESQRQAEEYVYRRGFLRSRTTHIPVVVRTPAPRPKGGRHGRNR